MRTDINITAVWTELLFENHPIFEGFFYQQNDAVHFDDM